MARTSWFLLPCVLALLAGCLERSPRPGAGAERMSYELDVGAHHVRLDLHRNHRLLAAGYRETRLEGGRSIEASRPVGSTDCLYVGTVERLDSSSAVPAGTVGLGLCDGIRGALVLDGQLWSVEPGDQADRVRVARVHGERPEDVAETALRRVAPPAEPLVQARVLSEQVLEVVLVNDAARSASYGGSPESHSLEVANLVDALFQNGDLTTPVRFVITQQITFDAADPYTPQLIGTEVDAASLLQAFHDYASVELPQGDVQFLLSGLTPSAGIGLAYQGGACDPSLDQGFAATLSLSDAAIAADIAHQCGHLLSMRHDGDGNLCGGGFIMSPVVTADPPTRWSACSDGYLSQFLATPVSDCLLNSPDVTAPQLAVNPSELQFGDVTVDQSSLLLLTVANLGNAELEVTSIGLSAGSSPAFTVDAGAALPLIISPGAYAEVAVTFTPTAAGPHAGVLEIASNDAATPIATVSCAGSAVAKEIPPGEQVDAILAFIDDALADGALVPTGPAQRVGALGNMIEAAEDHLDTNDLATACRQLADAYYKLDGAPRPPDFVSGPAAATLADMIVALEASIGCP